MPFTVTTPTLIPGVTPQTSTGYGGKRYGLYSLGSGRFFYITRSSASSTMVAIIFEIDEEGNYTWGTPYNIVTPDFTRTIQCGVYDISDERVIFFYGYDVTPSAANYVVINFVGLSITSHSFGSESGIAECYGIVYLPDKGLSVGVFYNSGVVVRTVSMSGGVVSFGTQGTQPINYPGENELLITNVGGDAVIAYLPYSGSGPQFSRVVVTGTDVSVLPPVISTVTSTGWCFGLAGDPNGDRFALYHQGASNQFIPGELSGASNLIFGLPEVYEPSGNDYESSGTCIHLGAPGNFATFIRIDGDSAQANVDIFQATTNNLEVDVDTDTDVQYSPPNSYWFSRFYNNPSSTYDPSINKGVIVFNGYDSTPVFGSYVFTVVGDTPIPLFWKNKTLQEEYAD